MTTLSRDEIELLERLLRVARATNPGSLGGRLDFTQPIARPALLSRPNPPKGRGASVVVASIYSTDKERAGADIVCDGVDDDVQVQAACDLCATVGGGRVLLSSPYFSFGGTVLVDDWVTVEGNGTADAVLIEVDDGVTAFQVDGDEACLRHMKLRGLGSTTVGNQFSAQQGSSGTAIVATRWNLVIEDVWVERFVTAMNLNDVGDEFLVQQCRIVDCDTGITATHATRSEGRILRNFIQNVDTAIVALGSGTYVAHNFLSDHDKGIRCGGSLTQVLNNMLDAQSGIGTGIKVEENGFSVSQIRVAYNSIYDVEGFAIEVLVKNTLVVGNDVQNHTGASGGTGAHCIYIDDVECTVAQNYIFSWADDPAATFDGVHLTANADRSTVTNNDMDGAAANRAGVYVSAGCTNALVALNRVRGAAAVVTDLGTSTRLNYDGGAGNWNRAL